MSTNNTHPAIRFLSILLIPIIFHISSETIAQTDRGYVSVNGLEMYYEVHGEGAPLILLHGGLGSSGMFNPILPALSDGRKVIAVDLQGHGRTADIDRPIRLETMGDDIAGLLRQLDIERSILWDIRWVEAWDYVRLFNIRISSNGS